MYKHILIATDGSELSTKGLDQGLQLAKHIGAKVTVVTVTDVWAAGALAAATPASMAEYEAAVTTAVEEILMQAKKFANDSGVDAETVHIANRYPADAIVEYSQAHGADLIIMASHGRRGIKRMFLGSQTNEVLALSTIPVLVIR